MMRVVVSDDPIEKAAELLADAIASADAARGHARVAIPGGSAVAALAPARDRLAKGVWSRVRLTWVDERCVDLASPHSNRGLAHRQGATEGVGEELALREDGERTEDSIARVERALRDRFAGGLDVTLLGMGEDGHIASIFPGMKLAGDRAIVHVPNSPKPPPDRLTLTREFLGRAPRAILLAAGPSKRGALERLLSGDRALPAHGLSDLAVVTDLIGLPTPNETKAAP